MGARRKGRIIAFQSLYRHDLSGADVHELMDFSWLDEDRKSKVPEEAADFARLLIQGTIEKKAEVDDAIRRQLENWDFSRIGRVDLAILRVSAYCLLHQPDIPPKVTIDEAIDIAKDYGSDDSYRFVNGVLDGLRKRTEKAT
jgi:transcription antitermination protein NusB